MTNKNSTEKHRMTWYVYAGGERIRRNAQMRGSWGYDVVCSCGWETRTGGGTRTHIEGEIWMHRWEAEHGFLD